MTSRRQMLGAGLAMGLWPAIRGLQAAVPSTDFRPLAVGCVLVDGRHEDAAVMGAAVANAGFNSVPLPRDVLALWHDRLLPQLRSGVLLAFGGITTPDGLFLLRTLAADQRRRVVYSAEHTALGEGRIRHQLRGNQATLARVVALSGEGDWRAQQAAMFGLCAATGPKITQSLLTRYQSPVVDAVPLVSWIIT